jgi:phosphoglycolate phosphatase
MNIVFDLDGTLIDSAPDIQWVAQAVLADRDRQALTLAETRSFIGEGAAVFVTRMMAARNIEYSAENHAVVLAEFLRRYEFSVDKAVFYPGVERTLAALKSAGHRLGLCTNKPERPARAVIEKMELGPLLDAVIAGDMLPSRKPDPAMLMAVLQKLGEGVPLYVGDSETDALTAEHGQVPFALFTAGYRKTPVTEIVHDWSFDDFAQLPDIVVAAGSGRRRVRQ